MANVSKGAAGEVLAARYLRDQGYRILGANYRTRFGEIDIIATDGTYIVFVEVKARAQNSYYAPREAVTVAKQRRIVKTALLFLSKHPTKLQPRFDVIEVVTAVGQPMQLIELNHLKNAHGG
ncbi:MAG: YraN family protein [Clostridia bacterium]|nr:YraN family protein [Clostridia bacterium]